MLVVKLRYFWIKYSIYNASSVNTILYIATPHTTSCPKNRTYAPRHSSYILFLCYTLQCPPHPEIPQASGASYTLYRHFRIKQTAQPIQETDGLRSNYVLQCILHHTRCATGLKRHPTCRQHLYLSVSTHSFIVGAVYHQIGYPVFLEIFQGKIHRHIYFVYKVSRRSEIL